MKRNEIERELCEKHMLLSQTDYVTNKLLETQIYGTEAEKPAMNEKYAEVCANRKAWRARINELEKMEPSDK